MENAQVFNIGNNGRDVFLKVNTIDCIGEAWYLSIMTDPNQTQTQTPRWNQLYWLLMYLEP